MDQAVEVTRDERATELATLMLEQEGVMRSIIGETIDSAKSGSIREAGRTYCPSSSKIRGALNRFPRAIDLASCPVDRGGTWHTHVTPQGIRNPVNSLPDMSNVIYGLTDVSIVPGSQSADVIVAPEDRESGIDVFENAIGASVAGPGGVTEAIRDGRIDPVRARKAARDKLSPLVYQVSTGYGDLSEAAAEIPPEGWAAPYGSGKDESFSGNRAGLPMFGPDSFQRAGQAGSEVFGGVDIQNQVISTAIGTIIGGVVSRVVFGE